jgi:hypothetical protein
MKKLLFLVICIFLNACSNSIIEETQHTVFTKKDAVCESNRCVGSRTGKLNLNINKSTNKVSYQYIPIDKDSELMFGTLTGCIVISQSDFTCNELVRVEDKFTEDYLPIGADYLASSKINKYLCNLYPKCSSTIENLMWFDKYDFLIFPIVIVFLVFALLGILGGIA